MFSSFNLMNYLETLKVFFSYFQETFTLAHRVCFLLNLASFVKSSTLARTIPGCFGNMNCNAVYFRATADRLFVDSSKPKRGNECSSLLKVKSKLAIV